MNVFVWIFSPLSSIYSKYTSISFFQVFQVELRTKLTKFGERKFSLWRGGGDGSRQNQWKESVFGVNGWEKIRIELIIMPEVKVVAEARYRHRKETLSSLHTLFGTESGLSEFGTENNVNFLEDWLRCSCWCYNCSRSQSDEFHFIISLPARNLWIYVGRRDPEWRAALFTFVFGACTKSWFRFPQERDWDSNRNCEREQSEIVKMEMEFLKTFIFTLAAFTWTPRRRVEFEFFFHTPSDKLFLVLYVLCNKTITFSEHVQNTSWMLKAELSIWHTWFEIIRVETMP